LRRACLTKTPASSWRSSHQHYFYGATQTLPVNAGDKLYTYVFLDPANTPSEVTLQWNDGTWEHRAYWGLNLIGWGTDGTASLQYMGPIPEAGRWIRLEVPASRVGLEGSALNGMAFTLYGGKATWDRAGKYNMDIVWVDDSVPGTANQFSFNGDNWDFVTTTNPSPISGTRVIKSDLQLGVHQHWFTDSNAPLFVGTGDKLYAYVYLDNMPNEVMLQWREGTNFEHRAFWGTESTFWGALNTDAMRYMGPIPNSWIGRWVRLEVPASLVGLEGKTLNGMAFTLTGGSATWDSAGKIKQAHLDQ
jgi:hypothetical protein